MHCLSGMQGVRKQVDFIRERGNKYAEFLMLRDSSVPRREDVLKGFCFVSLKDSFGIAPIFPHPFKPICEGLQLEYESPACSAG